MDFNQLAIFLVVAEELHFGRAAERLHMAQPPVSRAVAQFEKSLGIKLFERSTRKVELTQMGAQVALYAQRVMASVKEMQDRVHALKAGDTGQINIVFAGVSTHALIGELSRELRRTYPGIVPNFMSQNFAQSALDLVLQGDADIVLGRWDFLPATVNSSLILKERLVLVVPNSHRLSAQRSIDFHDLRDENFIALKSTHSVLYDRLLRLGQKSGFQPKIIQHVPDTSTALALTAAEMGVMLTLDSVEKNTQNPNIKFIPITDDMNQIELRMAWLPSNTNPVLPRTISVAASIWQLDLET